MKNYSIDLVNVAKALTLKTLTRFFSGVTLSREVPQIMLYRLLKSKMKDYYE